MKRYTIIILLILIATLQVFPQISKQINSLMSPNAANINLYGEIPVSLYTGTPNIEIPLYNEKIKDFEFPITLSYHSSGIRPDQRAGWTGLGWTLNAGGVISRTVNDLPDESYNADAPFVDKAGIIYSYGNLNLQHKFDSWINRDELRKIAQSDKTEYDTESDEFSFRFGKYSGKFYLIGKDKYKISSNYPVSVNVEWNSAETGYEIPFDKSGTGYQSYKHYKCLKGFSLTTEDGARYIFGKNIDAIEFSISFFGQHTDFWTATSWYLTKIILPTGHEINLNYQRGPFVNQMYLAVFSDLGTKTESSNGFFNPQPSCGSSSKPYIPTSYQGKLISPVYLREIKSDNSTITFFRSESYELTYESNIYSTKYSQWQNVSGTKYPFLPYLKSQEVGYPKCLDNLKWYKLDQILIAGNAGSKIISFRYNNKPTERLALLSLRESDKGTYTFSYDNLNKLPPYLSNKVDHWGFFNDTYAHVDNYQSYYNYREPKENVLKYGVLNKIQYPTGGYTEFVFEPHFYRKQTKLNRWEGVDVLSTNKLAGGLRIKQIKNSETSSGPSKLIKEFYYNSDFLINKTNSSVSSGVLGGHVQYYFTDYTVYAFNDKNVRKKISSFSSNSVLPSCNNSQGSHIGYSEVVEYYPDSSFSINKFTNFDNGYLDKQPKAIIQESRTAYMPYTSMEIERGLLSLKEDYNSNEKKVKSKNIEYTRDNINDRVVSIVQARYANVCPNTAVSYDEGVFYYIPTYSMLPYIEKETFYDPLTEKEQQSTTKTYTYYDSTFESSRMPTNLIKKVTVKNSDNLISEIEYKYPYTFTPPDNDLGFMLMKESKVINPVIEKIISNNHNSAADYKKTTETIKYTSRFNNNLITERVYYPKNKKIRFSDETEITEYSSEKVDRYGNPIHIIENDFFNTVYLWGYVGQYPIAEIKNATYDQVKTAIGVAPETLSEAITPDKVILLKLRNSDILKNALITTYECVPLVGVTKVTDPSGISNSYEYNNERRLKSIKDNTGNIIQEYTYHYFKAPPLQNLNIIGNEICSIVEIETFSTSVDGGSGQFDFEWELTDSSGTKIETSYEQLFNINFNKTGIYNIKCTIFDRINSNKLTTTKKVNVRNTVKFTDIKTISYSPCTYKDVTAYITSDEACKVNLISEVTGETEKGYPKAEIKIGAQTTTVYSYYGKSNHNISLPKGKVAVSIRIYNTGYQAMATLTFDKNSNPDINFSSPVLSVINFCSQTK